ncbi:hypothetical protein RFI_11318, partial [Reticulomyxa filosa]
MQIEATQFAAQLISKSVVSEKALLRLSKDKKLRQLSKQLHWVTFPLIQPHTKENPTIVNKSELFNHYYVGSGDLYPHVTRENLIKFYNSSFEKLLPMGIFVFPEQTMKAYNLKSSSILDYYPFPKTFTKNQTQKKMEWKLQDANYAKDKYGLDYGLTVLHRDTQEVMIWPDNHFDLKNISILKQ